MWRSVYVVILRLLGRAPEPSQRRRHQRESLPARFVIADIETTGLSAHRNHIIEIAAVRIAAGNDGPVDTFQTLIKKPGRKLTAKIRRMTGITDAMLAVEGRDLPDAVAAFLAFAGDDVIVFYNAHFDIAFLRKAAHASGREIPNRVCCALSVARTAWPGLASYRLADVAAGRGVEANGAHRALVDCAMTVPLYVAAVAEAGMLGDIIRR